METSKEFKKGGVVEAVYTVIDDEGYVGILTSLSGQGTNFSGWIDKVKVPEPVDTSKKILLDLALNSSINSPRFAEMDVDKRGKLIYTNKNKVLKSTYKYVSPREEVAEKADDILRQYPESIIHSIVSTGAIQGCFYPKVATGGRG